MLGVLSRVKEREIGDAVVERSTPRAPLRIFFHEPLRFADLLQLLRVLQTALTRTGEFFTDCNTKLIYVARSLTIEILEELLVDFVLRSHGCDVHLLVIRETGGVVRRVNGRKKRGCQSPL